MKMATAKMALMDYKGEKSVYSTVGYFKQEAAFASNVRAVVTLFVENLDGVKDVEN